MDWKHFEKWDLTEEDFRVDTYRKAASYNVYTRWVTVEIVPLDISVSCHSKKGQVKNKEKCLVMLDVILTNCVVQIK
jgi:protein subunit release factor A